MSSADDRREAEIRATIAGRTRYDEWRMIDDKARNGEEWLLSARRGEPMEYLMIVGFWHNGCWHTADGPDYSPTAFTMYMPLPEPPHD